jgi:long-chain acyl-CoA synthetase
MNFRILPDLVFQFIPSFQKSDCLMAKKDGAYRPISSLEVASAIESLASALMNAGMQKGDRVGILSENRPEWAYADLAILSGGGISVPIYATLPAKQIEYIINDSEMEVLFVSTRSQLEKILCIREATPRLRKLILFDKVNDLPASCETFTSLLENGVLSLKKDPDIVRKRAETIQPDDVFTLVYTSGTTGEPKGVMLTHNNLISNIESIVTFCRFDSRDTTLSFLPLSHIFERMAGYYTMLRVGCTIAYAETQDSIPQNLLEVKPTILMAVPRVYEKFYARVQDNIGKEKGIKKNLAQWAFALAPRYSVARLVAKNVSVALSVQHKLAEVILYRKIREKLGGRLRYLVSGGAALSAHLAYFFSGVGLTILEGYGLTETSPVIAWNRPDHFRFGTVGQAIPGVEVRIADDGEILTSGPHVMKGYFKKSKETSEAISEDGWFHTGDIGELDADGFLRITDRKKDLIVTSAGKNIAPQFVENILKTSRYVTQIVVVGNKRKFPSALIVPNRENVEQIAENRGMACSEMYRNPEILAEIQKDLDSLSGDLASFERVKKIALIDREFTIESGELTPSMKVRRNVVEKKYKDVIDGMYEEVV